MGVSPRRRIEFATRVAALACGVGLLLVGVFGMWDRWGAVGADCDNVAGQCLSGDQVHARGAIGLLLSLVGVLCLVATAPRIHARWRRWLVVAAVVLLILFLILRPDMQLGYRYSAWLPG